MSYSNRRSSIEICADILRLLRLGPASKVEVMHVAHITSEQTAKYLTRLIDAALVEQSGELMKLPAVRITNKGIDLLNMIESLREMIPEEGSLTNLHNSRITDLNIGQVLVSQGVAELVRESDNFSSFVQRSLERYRKGDWGEVSDEEKQLMNRSNTSGRRLVSSYQQGDLPELLITTNADRSYTVVLLPEEEASVLYIEPIDTVIPA